MHSRMCKSLALFAVINQFPRNDRGLSSPQKMSRSCVTDEEWYASPCSSIGVIRDGETKL